MSKCTKASVTPVLRYAFLLLFLVFIKVSAGAQTLQDTSKRATAVRDSLRSDSASRARRYDSLHFSKDSLDAQVTYHANDSAVLLIPEREFILYGKANTNYKDMKLEEAQVINYNSGTNIIRAYGGSDTSKGALNLPKFTQGDMSSVQDSITYNMRTQKGLVKSTYFQQDEIYVHAQTVKRVTKDITFAQFARFTTCNLDTPHYAFVSKRVELITNQWAITGPTHPEFEGVPVPIILPFGIFPLQRGRHSGLLPPQFTSNDYYGLGLEGLGYYKVINDNWDITTRANLYSYGTVNLFINPKYTKRYKYTGNFNLALQFIRSLNSGALLKDEFSRSSVFQITWSHSQDTRAHPGTSFSASVNAGSTRYNQLIPNNPYQNFNNQLTSSITYSKTWDQGKYNLTVSANHSQNSTNHLVNVSFPTATFSTATIYPFQQKEFVGAPKWYEKLGISYAGSFINQVSFYDTAFKFHRLLDTAQYGVQHTIPITLPLPPAGPVTLAPSVSYSEKWYGQRIYRDYNSKERKIDTSISRGLFTAREVVIGMSANTRIFGTYSFGPSSNVIAIRHEIKPFISLNYKPDLVKQYYSTIPLDSTGLVTRRVSVFDGSVIGGFSEGTFGGINFGIDNLLEMKVKDKKGDSTGTGDHKVRLIDGIGLTGGYNFFDTLHWSPISITFRSTLFEKVNITGGATIDPYGTDNSGNRINKLLWTDGNFGRFTGGSLAVSTSFQSKSTDKRKDQARITDDPTLTPDEQMRELEYARRNPAEFVDFNVPWNVQASLSLNFARQLLPDLTFATITNAALNLGGDLSISPKWKAGGSIYYDVTTLKMQMLTLFLTRDMHCWQMAINITPVGLYKSFSIVISPKGGPLRDLRINRSRSFYSN